MPDQVTIIASGKPGSGKSQVLQILAEALEKKGWKLTSYFPDKHTLIVQKPEEAKNA